MSDTIRVVIQHAWSAMVIFRAWLKLIFGCSWGRGRRKRVSILESRAGPEEFSLISFGPYKTDLFLLCIQSAVYNIDEHS